MESHDETGCQAPEGASIGSIVNGCLVVAIRSRLWLWLLLLLYKSVNFESKIVLAEPSADPSVCQMKIEKGPNRCTACVGLTGFSCRCGNLLCTAHLYSEKHECPFDCQAVTRDAITKANPIAGPRSLIKYKIPGSR
ncbi:hypothetical protein V6N12_031171 [Hibiscus sabdariffa]|uniref:AN1-type domain-containing protein n=1 Tax=Hibiscus sabdariffa TaxID=183260 RepID=A0ABR2E854_9ROSI